MTAPTPPLSAEARLAALRQDLEALADEWAKESADGWDEGEAQLRAVLAEHATPSDDTAAMWIDPNPPGVTPLPSEQAREILDALDDTPSDAPQDECDGRLWDDPDVAEAMGPRCLCGHRHLPAHPETCCEALCHCPGLRRPHDPPQDEHGCGDYPAPCNCDDPGTHDGVISTPASAGTPQDECGSCCYPDGGDLLAPGWECSGCGRVGADPASASADTEGVRLTDSECRQIVHASIARDRVFNGQDGDENAPADVLLTTVREILAARLRAATEGKGEA